MSGKQDRDRMVMPGDGPTDEDLRHDVDLTRQELADTVDALADKADIKGRARRAGQEKVTALHDRGQELAGRLPDPVAERVRPMLTAAARRPAATVGGLALLLVLLRVLSRRRS